MVLAYYPSPEGSPQNPFTSVSPSADASSTGTNTTGVTSVPMRKRLTPRKEGAAGVEQKAVQVERIGAKGEVAVVGRRIRCKMCRCAPFPFFLVLFPISCPFFFLLPLSRFPHAFSPSAMQARTRRSRPHHHPRAWKRPTSLPSRSSRHGRPPNGARKAAPGRSGEGCCRRCRWGCICVCPDAYAGCT